MQNFTTKPLAGLLLAACVLAACSDSAFSTGLPPNKGLGTLTPDEANKLCAATVAYVEGKSRATTCQLRAVLAALPKAKTDSEARMLCKTQFDQCMAEPATGNGAGPNGQPAPTGCQPPPASCTATVGEYETCLTDVGGAYDKAFAGLPNCDNLTLMLSGLPSAQPSVQTPASCAAVQKKCPGVSIGPGNSGRSGGGS